MPHEIMEVRKVQGPFGETTYRSYCECGHFTHHATRINAELDLAMHLEAVEKLEHIGEMIIGAIAANFVDTRKDEKPDTRSRHEWFRDHEVRRNYE